MAVQTAAETWASRWDLLASKHAPAPEAPPPPRIIEKEHEVSPDELPRGPKAVWRAFAEPWTVRCLRVVAEELEKPKRGGECWGLAFEHPDGRYGWVTWSRLGSDPSAILKRTGALLSPVLSVSELKEVVARG